MSWANSNFKYLWRATFENKLIAQHPADRYSKHDPNSDYNPSSFRDFLDYFEGHEDELIKFELCSREADYKILLDDPAHPKIIETKYGRWGSVTNTLLHKEKRPLHNVRIIYYRNMEATIVDGKAQEPRVLSYVVGYQGLDENGNNRQKSIIVI